MNARLRRARTSARFDARMDERRSGRTFRSADSLVRTLASFHQKLADKAVCVPFLRYLCFLLFASVSLSAHELRPAFLEIREDRPGEFSVLWKTPMRGDMRLALAPEFSGRTEHLTPVVSRKTDNAAVQTWRFKSLEPLRGQTLRIAGLDGTMTDALVRMEFADETTWTQRFTPGQPEAKIPVRESALTVAGVYLKLGVEHILLGIDHLLFVLALLILTGSGWKLVQTVTAFTVAHSITLGLAALGFVQVPSAPVEAVIALSIVFVAAEILRVRGAGFSPLQLTNASDAETISEGSSLITLKQTEVRAPSLTARAPWVVAFSFGLLHGFGFAGALSEIGLPQGQIPVALLFFNVGVEAGQLLFVAAVLSFIAVVRRIRLPLPRWAQLAPPYAIGSVAMFWVIQRIAAF